jgi:hypothetical protein
MADANCKATVNCQYTCYNNTMLDAGGQQACADACPGQTAALWVAYDMCNGTTCMSQCLCP